MTTLSDSSMHEDDHDIVAEYENENSDENNAEESGGEGEKDEDQNTKQKDASSTKRQVRNHIPTLNTARLKGPKGIQTIEKYFEGFKFNGKGHEKKDLDRVMKRMEHWSHRLFPKLDFDDFLAKVEKLGVKRDLGVFIKRYRQDMVNSDDCIITNDIIDEKNEEREESEPIDEFDLLIAEQIEKQKQVTRPQEQEPSTSHASETLFDQLISETNSSQPANNNTSASQLTDEVKERIERNRQQAIQRRLARLQALKEEETKKAKLDTTNDTKIMETDNENNTSIKESASVLQVSDITPTTTENMDSETNDQNED